MTIGHTGSTSYLGPTQWTSPTVAAAGQASTSPTLTLSTAGAVTPPVIAPTNDTPPLQGSTANTLVLKEVPKFDEQAFAAALNAQWARSDDMADITRNLAAALKDVALIQPDLDNAKFDIQTDNGLIKVVSSDMSETDRQWLQNQLNANSGLLHATQSFHDHTVTNYVERAKAFDIPITASDVKAASDWADQQFNFLNMLQTEVADPINRQYRDTLGEKTVDAVGNAVNLTTDPHTVLGLISFVDKLNELQTGFIHTTLEKSGHVINYRLNDPFSAIGFTAATYQFPGPLSPADLAAKNQ